MQPGSTDKTKIRRLAYKASESQQDLYSIIDENLVAHVGFIENGLPVVIPMTYGRVGDKFYLHGSTGSRLMRILAENSSVCISITELNALKVARSTFNTGMHYRAVVIFGKAEIVPDSQKLQALDALSDGLIPGRVAETRPTNKKELAATIIIQVDLSETSVKISKNEVDDPEEDLKLGYWAGIVPIRTVVADPIPADDESRALPIPQSIRRFAERYSKGR